MSNATPLLSSLHCSDLLRYLPELPSPLSQEPKTPSKRLSMRLLINPSLTAPLTFTISLSTLLQAAAIPLGPTPTSSAAAPAAPTSDASQSDQNLNQAAEIGSIVGGIFSRLAVLMATWFGVAQILRWRREDTQRQRKWYHHVWPRRRK